ncbi:hypothetical protein BG011_002442, partial [Mortierella polycephala]
SYKDDCKLGRRKSGIVGHWFDAADQAEQFDYAALSTPLSFLQRSVDSSRDGSAGAVGPANTNQFLDSSSAIQTLHGTENFESLSSENQNALLSHLDTPQMHFLRMSRELGGGVFVQEKLESTRNNPAYSRFFKPEPTLPGSSALHAVIDDVDDDDPDDKDYHLPAPPDIPHIVYIKKVGRGFNSQRKKFCVDQVPSGSSCCTEGSEDGWSPIEEELDVFVPARTKAELEREGEVLRQAPDIIERKRSILEPTIYQITLQGLDLAYDSTMKPEYVYHTEHVKDRRAQKAKLLDDVDNMDSLLDEE